jgi:membrane protease subunit HflK
MSWDWDKLKMQQQGGSGLPPQVDEIVQRMKAFKFKGGPIWIFALVIAVFFGLSTFYTVEVDEVGVVQRLGRYVRTSQPGLNFKLPSGLEKVTKVKVRRVFKEEFGVQAGATEVRGRFAQDSENSNPALMLTGDLNVALVPWIVQYRIKDPFNFLFKVQNSRKLLNDMSEAAMRLVVGDRSINEVISKREEIADEAKRVLQTELKRTNVPEPVQPSFNEVNQATQEKEKLIYQAKEDYNKAIPSAKGEAERTIRMAEGYALDRLNRAKGDASRFTDVYYEYIKAEDVTRRRLYLESLRELFPKLGPKFIIDSDQNNLLPLLNLGKSYGVEK